MHAVPIAIEAVLHLYGNGDPLYVQADGMYAHLSEAC